MTCQYIPSLKISFGRTISDAQLNAEFEAIEKAFACLETKTITDNFTEFRFYDNGIVRNPVVLDPGNGAVQLLTLVEDTDLSLDTPAPDDPVAVTLLVRDGGNGRFNLPLETAWATGPDSSGGTSMDGKPWLYPGIGGDYGAVIQCVHDGIGWLYMTFGRLDFDLSEPAQLEDVYLWR